MFPTTWNIWVVNILRMRLKKSKLLENLTYEEKIAKLYVTLSFYLTKLYVTKSFAIALHTAKSAKTLLTVYLYKIS